MSPATLRNGLTAALNRLRGGDAPQQRAAAPGASVIRPERFQGAGEPAPQPRKIAKPKYSFARMSAIVMILIPTLLGALYYGLIASDQYSANFQLAVRSNDRPLMEAMAPAMAGLNSSPVASDSYILVEYLRSRQLVEDIAKTVDLRGMYSRSDHDFVSRLSSNASIEDLVDYWKKKIDVRFESQSGIVTASIRGFRPDDALIISQSALKLSEGLVNQLSKKAREEAVSAAEDDVRRMEIRLATSIAMLKKFRDRTGVIDPAKGAGAGLQVLGKLQEELVRLRTQLSILSKNMQPTAPPIINLKQRIAATEEQVTNARSEVGRNAADAQTPELTSQLLSEFESLELERQFAEKAYTATLTSLERARSDAIRNQRYLSVFVEPHMPQESSHPKRIIMILTVLGFAFLAWAVFLLVYLTVKEHIT